MKFYWGLLALFFSTNTLAQAESGMRTSQITASYHTAFVKASEMNCDASSIKTVMNSERQTLLQLCPAEYSNCMFYGACVVETESKQLVGLNYHRYDKKAEQSYFNKIDLKTCPYGYGLAKVSDSLAGESCLIPYRTVAADALEHKAGDVLYIPKLAGLALPNDEVHDGYVIISDYAENSLGSGFDYYTIFTGYESKSNPNNALAKVGLTDPSKTYQYKVITGAKAEEIRQKNGFSILKTFKRQFKLKPNPQLEGGV